MRSAWIARVMIACACILVVVTSARAYYSVDTAKIIKIGVDAALCDATLCRVYIYFDKNLSTPATGCNPTVKDRAILRIYKDNASHTSALAYSKMYDAAMSAYLAGTLVYVRVDGCDTVANLRPIEYLENK